MKTIVKEWAKSPKFVCEMLFGMVLSVIYTVVNARLVVLIAAAIDDYEHLPSHLPMIAAFCVITGVTLPLSSFMRKDSTSGSFTRSSNDCVAKVLHIPSSVFTKYGVDHIDNVTGNIGSITNAVKWFIRMMELIIHVIVTFISIWLIDQAVILPLLGIYVVAVTSLAVVSKKFDTMFTDARKLQKARNKEVTEIVNAFSEVRAFCTEGTHLNKLVGANNEIHQKLRGANLVGALLVFAIEAVDSIGMICILGYAAIGIARGTMSTTVALSLIMYVWRIGEPLQDIVDFAMSIAEVHALIPDFKELMTIPDEEDGEIELKSFNNSITLEDLSFKYNDSDSVLNNINLTIKKGEKVGICGPSGGGKSTLLKLIPATYRDFEGSLKIDGIDVRDLKKGSVRNKIGFVHQDVHIFDTTIYDNIVYGSPNATMNDVIEACKKAAIYDFIQSLPDKFNTQVGPKGLKLSGGQKQRISLARVFLKDADIILLDEATSALDNTAEDIVQESLAMFSDKTVITVAHRLSTIKDSDKIVVIDHHNVVEQGTHDELIKLGGVYASLQK